ncbi:MAG: hypothetical protein MZV63_35275 [Marinilabiliales bacterium]|nr:hypothetical protein [Marinilabiliales bacterium]
MTAERCARFGETITRLREDVCYCSVCHGISDTPVCEICSDASRDRSLICVVENVQDVMAVENTRQFRGSIPCPGRDHITR